MSKTPIDAFREMCWVGLIFCIFFLALIGVTVWVMEVLSF
jgi:hypothetical protein